jgi:hypothetical protein
MMVEKRFVLFADHKLCQSLLLPVFSKVTNFGANAPLALARKFGDRVKRVTRPHNVWSVRPKECLLRNIVCNSSLFYLLSGIKGVQGYNNYSYSADANAGDLVWGPVIIAVGTIGIVHGWVCVWGTMHRKWASPLRVLLIGLTSIILGFLALGWGLYHTDPVLSGDLLIPFHETVIL